MNGMSIIAISLNAGLFVYITYVCYMLTKAKLFIRDSDKIVILSIGLISIFYIIGILKNYFILNLEMTRTNTIYGLMVCVLNFYIVNILINKKTEANKSDE